MGGFAIFDCRSGAPYGCVDIRGARLQPCLAGLKACATKPTAGPYIRGGTSHPISCRARVICDWK